MSRSAIAVAGNTIVDTIKYVDVWPNRLELAHILSMDRSLGGLVCNVGVDIARLDPQQKVYVVGHIGDDANGAYVRQVMARHPNIDTSCLWEGGVTSFTDVMTEKRTGERTFFTYGGADNDLVPQDMERVPLEECALLHVGYQLLLRELDKPDAAYGTQMARLLAEAQARGTATSMDVVSEHGGRGRALVPHALKYVDYFSVNEMEAGQITGIELTDERGPVPEKLVQALRALKEMGVRRRAVIHTPTLSAGLDERDELVFAPTLNLPDEAVVSSVGAGDAFAAGFLLETTRGKSLAEALRSANAAAACSLSAPGGTDGVPTLPEALEYASRFEPRHMDA